jgi:hypothetical protein
MVLTGYQLLLYIALAAFVIGLIIVAVDFASDANLSTAGVNAFITMIVIAVVVVIIAVILERTGTIHKS